MHNLESVQENGRDEVHSDFKLQTDHLISDRQPDLVRVNKKKKKKRNCRIDDFAAAVDYRIKICRTCQIKKKKKKKEHVDGDANCN